MWLSQYQTAYYRWWYDFSELTGDLGGTFECVMLFFGFFMYPLSYYSYNMRAMNLLYFAKTKNQTLMKKKIFNKKSQVANHDLLSP